MADNVKQYALFYEGKQVSKAHENKTVAYFEAYDQKAVITGRFNPGRGREDMLSEGYEVKEVSNGQ